MVGMIAYLSYLVAEHFGCSGIVAIFTCAVVMSHYALYNVQRETRKATRHTAEVFSYMCEGAIFLYVGLDTIDPVTWQVCTVCGHISSLLYGQQSFCVVLFGLVMFMPLYWMGGSLLYRFGQVWQTLGHTGSCQKVMMSQQVSFGHLSQECIQKACHSFWPPAPPVANRSCALLLMGDPCWQRNNSCNHYCKNSNTPGQPGIILGFSLN